MWIGDTSFCPVPSRPVQIPSSFRFRLKLIIFRGNLLGSPEFFESQCYTLQLPPDMSLCDQPSIYSPSCPVGRSLLLGFCPPNIFYWLAGNKNRRKRRRRRNNNDDIPTGELSKEEEDKTRRAKVFPSVRRTLFRVQQDFLQSTSSGQKFSQRDENQRKQHQQ